MSLQAAPVERALAEADEAIRKAEEKTKLSESKLSMQQCDRESDRKGDATKPLPLPSPHHDAAAVAAAPPPYDDPDDLAAAFFASQAKKQEAERCLPVEEWVELFPGLRLTGSGIDTVAETPAGTIGGGVDNDQQSSQLIDLQKVQVMRGLIKTRLVEALFEEFREGSS